VTFEVLTFCVCLYSGKRNLDAVQLQSNELSGELEDRFSGSFSLRILSLWNNFLNGTLPVSLGELENLQALELDGNDFEGDVPAVVCDLQNTGILGFVSADCDEVNCPCCSFCCFQDGSCDYVIPQRRLRTSPLSKTLADRPGSMPLKQRSTRRRLEASSCPVRYIWRAGTGELEFSPL
jgi:hypothetical protein